MPWMSSRVGFLGAGFIANLHAFQVQQCATPNEIVAVFDPDPQRRRAFSEWTGASECPDPEAVIERSDVVFICTWTAAHEPMVALVVAAQRALFLEKPLGIDLDSAGRISRMVTEAGTTHTVGLVLRSSPAFLSLRHMVNHSDAGRVMNAALRDDQYFPTQGVYDSDWRGDRRRAGSGVLLEHSIHDLDILEWLFGPITHVNAQKSNFHEVDGIEDSISVLMRFDAGHTATLTSVWHDVLSRPSQRRMEVFNTCAYSALEGDLVGPLNWTCQGAGPDDIVEQVIDEDSILDWLSDREIEVVSAEERFLRHVAGESGDPGPSVEEALRAHVLVDAIYRSAADGGSTVATP